MRNLLIIFVLALSLLSTSCTTTEKRDSATVGGAVVGGVAGSALTGGSVAGTIAGAVGGGYIGNRVAQ